MLLFVQCLEILSNYWHLKQQTTHLMYFIQWCCVPSMLIPSLSSLSQRVSLQVKQTIGRGWWLHNEWNLLKVHTFSWVFSSIILVRSFVVILGFIFFIMIFICFLEDWGIEQVLPGYTVFKSCSSSLICSSALMWIAIPPLGRRYVVYFNFFSSCLNDSLFGFRGVFWS